jgi:hypothetical protein
VFFSRSRRGCTITRSYGALQLTRCRTQTKYERTSYLGRFCLDKRQPLTNCFRSFLRSLELIFEAKRSVKRWATYFARCLVKLPRMLRKIHRFPPFTSLLSKWPLRTSVSFNLNLGYSRTCFRRCKEPIPYRCAKSVSAYFVGYSTVFPVYFIQERTGDSNITPSCRNRFKTQQANRKEKLHPYLAFRTGSSSLFRVHKLRPSCAQPSENFALTYRVSATRPSRSKPVRVRFPTRTTSRLKAPVPAYCRLIRSP